MPRFELIVETADMRRRCLPLGAHPLRVGRSPRADLVLPDPRVSWDHLRIWTDDHGALHLTDPGSSNGTWVDGQRVVGTSSLSTGSTVDVAGCVTVHIGDAVHTSPELTSVYVLEDQDTGLLHPIGRRGLHIGPEPDADLRIPGAPPTTLSHTPEGLVATGLGRVEPGHLFVLGGVRLRLVQADPVPRPTITGHGATLLGYRVQVRLHEAVATIASPAGVEMCTLRGETRATLLWVLACAMVRDLGRPESERGWYDDRALVARVWGRSDDFQGQNRLKVAVHRVRRLLEADGVVGALIQRADGRTRLRAAHVEPQPAR